jgi:TetR/AcrR family transcriptional regulator, transcriptional repressor for nem operon
MPPQSTRKRSQVFTFQGNMARPREFDETAVLNAATELFWSRGFEAASSRELADRMGLTTASLYNAYSDKRTLYRQVLERYASDALGWCGESLAGDKPAFEAFQAFFSALAREGTADPHRKGCLIVNAGLETAPHDPEFKAIVAGVFRRLERMFRDCVVRGQAEGSVTRAQSADDLARVLLGVMLGMRVLARTRPERALLEGVARTATEMLKP